MRAHSHCHRFCRCLILKILLCIIRLHVVWQFEFSCCFWCQRPCPALVAAMTHGTGHTSCSPTVITLCVEELHIHILDLICKYSTSENLYQAAQASWHCSQDSCIVYANNGDAHRASVGLIRWMNTWLADPCAASKHAGSYRAEPSCNVDNGLGAQAHGPSLCSRPAKSTLPTVAGRTGGQPQVVGQLGPNQIPSRKVVQLAWPRCAQIAVQNSWISDRDTVTLLGL